MRFPDFLVKLSFFFIALQSLMPMALIVAWSIGVLGLNFTSAIRLRTVRIFVFLIYH